MAVTYFTLDSYYNLNLNFHPWRSKARKEPRLPHLLQSRENPDLGPSQWTRRLHHPRARAREEPVPDPSLPPSPRAREEPHLRPSSLNPSQDQSLRPRSQKPVSINVLLNISEKKDGADEADYKGVKPPKPNSAYIYFSLEAIPRIKNETGMKHSEAMGEAGREWNTLNEE
jgi:hypothetical protein